MTAHIRHTHTYRSACLLLPCMTRTGARRRAGMGCSLALARRLVSICILQLLDVVLADACMVNHWFGVVYTYAAVGLLLICYGRLPRLIDPLCRKVLNKHAVQLQTEESQALHRGSNLRTRFRTCTSTLPESSEVNFPSPSL